MDKYRFTVKKTLGNVFVFFLLFVAGELLNSIFFDFIFLFVKLPIREIYVILRMIGSLCFTVLLFRLYTTKILRMKMEDFGIDFNIKKWGVIVSVLLPAFVIFSYVIIGKVNVNTFSFGEVFLIITASALIAIKSGITEEILFRGYIMKLLEWRWNKYVAIFVPSFIFSLLHIPSMEKITAGGVALLIISGTLVGVMFSLVAYRGNSISNSALIHAFWNFAIITDILHITTEKAVYGKPIFSIILFTENPLLTGSGFGIEASIISIIAYSFVCIIIGFFIKHEPKSSEKGLE